jgi:Zn-dependent protease
MIQHYRRNQKLINQLNHLIVMVFEFLDITRNDILGPLGLIKYSDSFFFELIDMLIMSLAIGYIFSNYISKPTREDYDPLKTYKRKTQIWNNLKFAALVAGGAVVLHELSHKFIAMAFGAKAVLYAPYGFYLLVIFLKMVGFPFIFFVGGFVAHGPLPPLQSAIVAIAGPLMNILLWGLVYTGIKNNLIKRKYVDIAVAFGRINLFLGIFNLIPIPGFDGFNFFASLFKVFF